ncbi:MAG: ATPase V [Spirochaetales bacterium]|nr:ATPase V [Spirochaetales bacterium]
MMFTTKMKYLTAVVLDKDVEAVTKELLADGVLHFVNIAEVSSGLKNKVQSVTPQISLTRIAELKKRIESFLNMIGILPEKEKALDITQLTPVDLEQSEKELDKLSESVQGIRDRQKNIQQEILKLEDIKRQIELFGDIRSSLKERSHFSFLNVQTGIIPENRFEDFNTEFKTLPSVVLNFHTESEQSSILLITMKRDDNRVNALLLKYGWVDAEIDQEMDGIKENVVSDLDNKLKIYNKEQQDLHDESFSVIKEKGDTLQRLWANLRMNELYYKIQSYFSKTSRTVIFSGWVPAGKADSLEKGIDKATKGLCYMEWSNPEKLEREEKTKVKVPVQLKNPKFLAPFQMLVKNYAIPEYGTIDPTPFVAVAYLIMFGLMFGDAGHGLVLLCIGFLGMFFDKKASGNIFNLFKLISYCGVSAICAGVLFGSYFGMEWFPPLWFDYHAVVLGHVPGDSIIHDIYGILQITLYFGIGVIFAGLILNWINLVRQKRWLRLFLDKTGLLGAWVYGGGIYIGYYFMTQNGKLPDDTTLLLLAFIPMLLFLLKPVLSFFTKKTDNHHARFTIFTLIDFFMEWIVELLEVFGGYLANTLSFMRVAGLGIAHTSLMVAFFKIADMTNSPIFAPMVLIFGNILVIALEGLSAGIQSLRLNYYEFFSKYFSGTGEAYTPVSLSTSQD